MVKQGFQNRQSSAGSRVPPKGKATGAAPPKSAVAVRSRNSTTGLSSKAVTLATSRAVVPKVQPPLKPPADPRVQVAEALAKQVHETLGLKSSGAKAKALEQAVIGLVTQALPKYMPVAKVAALTAKAQGPPPKVVHTLVPVGTLGAVAATMAPVSQEKLYDASVIL